MNEFVLLMNLNLLYEKALNDETLSHSEGLILYENAPFNELIFIANEIRKKKKGDEFVTWQIDRNINITNVCISGCKFCNFHKKLNEEGSYITTLDEYKQKIDELFIVDGNQVLLQGGCHPKLGLSYYTSLFKELKGIFPALRLHALGPAEIAHLAKIEKKNIRFILSGLIAAGLDSLPGAGAEILSDRVRSIVSPAKCNSETWLDVMREAHKLNLLTSATMMFGHIETKEERIEHLLKLRDLQNERPNGTIGFMAFICWPFQDEGTVLNEKMGISNSVSAIEYIRTIAIARIMLNNIPNIQASWLTVGKQTAQICLHAGANDLGSIMIEENVVSSAGANYTMNALEMQNIILEAGFEPKLRNQAYEIIE